MNKLLLTFFLVLIFLSVSVNASDWTKFHFDNNNRGATPELLAVPTGELWNVSKGANSWMDGQASPAIANGIVYIGSDDAKLYAFNANTGVEIWNASLSFFTDASPAIANGIVYIGSTGGLNGVGAKLYAFDAITGVEIWNKTSSDNIYSSPAVANGIVYFGNDDGIVYALNAVTGAEIWSVDTRYYVHTSPAVVDGVVYVGTNGGAGADALHALNAITGAYIWNTTTGGIRFSSPAIENGVLFISILTNILYDPNAHTINHESKLYAFDATTGVEIWNTPTGGGIYSSPAIANGIVYVGRTDSKLYAFDATTGVEIWNTPSGGIYSSPAIANGIVYVGSTDSKLYAFNATTGVEIWNGSAGSAIYSSPAISNGKIYVGTEENKLYAFGSLTGYDPSGYVYYLDVDNTTSPLEGALVKINDTLFDYTDASGYYQITGVPNGFYTLNVSHSDFTTDSKTISNAAPKNDFILKFAQGLRFVQLTDVHIGPDPSSCSWGNSESKDCMSSLQTSLDRFDIVRDDIIANKPNFVLITGDLVEWNSAYQYSFFNTHISKFKENNIDVHIVPGNHDRRGKEHPQNILEATCPKILNYNCYNNLDNYRNYISSNDSSGVYEHEDGDYFEANNGYRFIGLDSGYDASSSLSPTGSGLSPGQINFTRNNILNGRTIIFMHHPAMDDYNSSNVISENRDEFINLTSNRDVKLVLTGHTHKSKFFDSNGRVKVYPNGKINVTVPFKDINTFISIIKPPFPARSPLFIQTRSATKEDYTLPGYLIVNIQGTSVLKERISLEDVRIIGSNITPVTILYLNSPADLHVYDESGRHTGLNATGEIENSIPDSYYFEEYKFGNTTLPAFARLYNTTLNYTYEIVSNFSRENITSDQAMFNFTIEQKNRGAITTIKYNNVSINRDSKAYLQINTTQTNYTMQIDLNNDGIIDTTKQPDTIVTDYAPAATIISPADGSTWDQGQPVTFNGIGIDREDGTLSKLTWVSNRDDVIGQGNFTTANLSAGVHNIILLVNDSVGQVNTANMVITVRDTVPPALNIEYPPENKIFNKQNITVRGFAYDDSGILNVTVNNLHAGKENWNVILSLNEGRNVINVTAIDNKGFSTAANRMVYYNSSLASDTEPPAAITNLTHKTGYSSVNRAWINWTWDNPKDGDLSYVRIYLDNIPMENTSRSYFNISGLSSSASYTINIQSADIVDNINLTEVKDTVRTAAKDPPSTRTSPEAIIKFDTSSKDFRVYNSETGAEVSFVELPSKLRQYTLRYGAGNTLSLVLNHKKAGNGAEIKVISMQYNGGAVIEAAKNTGRAEYSKKKDMLKELQQKIEVKKLFDANAKYSAKKGETEIKIKNEGQKELKQTRAGIVMLELLTDNGRLKLKY